MGSAKGGSIWATHVCVCKDSHRYKSVHIIKFHFQFNLFFQVVNFSHKRLKVHAWKSSFVVSKVVVVVVVVLEH